MWIFIWWYRDDLPCFAAAWKVVFEMELSDWMQSFLLSRIRCRFSASATVLMVNQEADCFVSTLLPGEPKTQVIVWFTGIEDSMPDALVVFCSTEVWYLFLRNAGKRSVPASFSIWWLQSDHSSSIIASCSLILNIRSGNPSTVSMTLVGENWANVTYKSTPLAYHLLS